MNMRIATALLCAALAAPALAADPGYARSVEQWRAETEQRLKRDNGWLTLAGRYVIHAGANTFGTGPGNDIVFPAGLGPDRMGTITVDPGHVSVDAAAGLSITQDGATFTHKEFKVGEDVRDWVAMGRASFHVIERNGRYVLRLADRESPVRARFGGRVWYPVDQSYRVMARFVPYDPPRKIAIVDVLDEVSEEPAPGYVEFRLHGRTYRLDAIGEDDGLFFVFRDATAGKTTYGSGRFLYVEPKPRAGDTFALDFNRAYNPPCAFSAYTTCPLPPKQNVLATPIEAGERYPPRTRG